MKCSEVLCVTLSLILFFTSSTLLANQEDPLIFLERNILSSSDILSCSSKQDVQNILSQVIQQEQLPLMSDQSEQETKTNHLDNVLVGFPLTTMNRPMAIGGVITDLPDSGENVIDQMNRKNVLAGYKLSILPIKEVQARISSDNQGCFLDLVSCLYRDDCLNDEGQFEVYARFPVLGISQKHQAVIVDPSLFGRSLNHKVALFPVAHPVIYVSEFIPNALTEEVRSSIVDFSQSTLVFDITSVIDWSRVYFSQSEVSIHPNNQSANSEDISEMTSRWFIKFDVFESEENFITRPPVEGIETIDIYSHLHDAYFIQRWKLLDDNNKPRLIKYYIKNVPEEYQLSIQEAFEYWNSIFIELTGSPIFTYKFIQGDYDGQQEIIAGDIRFNVLEWDTQYKMRYLGSTFKLYSENTGKMWASDILIQGPRLVEEYQRWFRYSQMIRDGQPVEDMPLSANPLERNMMSLVSQVRIRQESKTYLQVVQLAPLNETFESYMSGFIRFLSAHELGHVLGLDHNYKANIYAQDGYVGNSVMDTAGFDKYKPSSGYYDRMAIAYTYLGILPDQKNISCSDKNVALIDHIHRNTSPECSKIDATNNPLENFAQELQETFSLLTERRNSRSYPYLIWNNQVERYVVSRIFGITSYYLFADFYYDKLQSVSIEGHRPTNARELKEMIVDKYITPFVCQPIAVAENIESQNVQTLSVRRIQRNIFRFKNVMRRYVLSYLDLLDKAIQCPNLTVRW